eukprot:2762670-Pleurochrysis_carterae.AAC.1
MERLQLRLDRLILKPPPPSGGFILCGGSIGLVGAEEKKHAMHYLWARDYTDVVTVILTSNPDIAELLEARTANVYNSRLFGDEESDVRR